MLITTTANIEGKSIHSYLGIVSGTDIYLVGGIFGGGLGNQENLYSAALGNAITKMKQKAANMGANAIVGVSTNFTSPGGLNNMIVVVTGTAVITKDYDTTDSVKTNCANPNSHSAVVTVQDTSSTVNSASGETHQPKEWNPAVETTALKTGETNIKCLNCDCVQFSGNKSCKRCGAKFTKIETLK